MGTSIDTAFLKVIARRKDDFIMILGLNRIFSAEDLEALPDQAPAVDQAATL